MSSYQFYDQRYLRAYSAGLEYLNPHTLDPTLLKFMQLNLLYGHLLEVGCGEGFEAYHLAKLGFSVTALDCSCHALNKAKSSNIHPNISFEYCDVVQDNLQHYQHRFTFVYDIGCFHVLGTHEERRTYLNNVKLVLKNNGYLYMRLGIPHEQWHQFKVKPVGVDLETRLHHNTFFNRQGIVNVTIPSTPLIEPLTIEEYQKLLRTNGFQITHCKVEPGGRVFPLELVLLLQKNGN
jgi:cyclopropane fatty-acyl-phospholipid synthase-like methyltransferase